MSKEAKLLLSERNRGKILNTGRTHFKKGQKPWNIGVKRDDIVGEKHILWKGDRVSYSGIHHWLKRHLGKARWCTWCFSMQNVQWANISHEYKRDLNDYFQLCVKCHKKYDQGRSDKKEVIARGQYQA